MWGCKEDDNFSLTLSFGKPLIDRLLLSIQINFVRAQEGKHQEEKTTRKWVFFLFLHFDREAYHIEGRGVQRNHKLV